MSALKNLAKYVYNRSLYPHAQIGFGSRVTGGAALGENVHIDKDCYVFGSKIGDRVQVHQDCRIFSSVLGSDVVVYPHTVLNDVRFGSYSYISERGLISRANVGRFCSIGPEFLYGFGEHPLDRISTSPIFYSTRRQCGTSFADKDQFEEAK